MQKTNIPQPDLERHLLSCHPKIHTSTEIESLTLSYNSKIQTNTTDKKVPLAAKSKDDLEKKAAVPEGVVEARQEPLRRLLFELWSLEELWITMSS